MNRLFDWLVGSLGYLALVGGIGLLVCYAVFGVISRVDNTSDPMERHWIAIGISLVLSGYIVAVALPRLHERLDALEENRRSNTQ